MLVAAIATILPAVAVADVMISGTADFTGSSAPPVFLFQAGPNYANAHAAGLFNWPTQQEVDHMGMGDGDLQGITNQSVTLLNVLEVTFSASGMFYLNLTDEWAAPGQVYVTNTLQTGFPAVGGTPLNSAVPVTLWSGAVTPSTVLYVCFYLPGGAYSSANHFNMTGTLVNAS